MTSSAWSVERSRSTAAEFHGRPIPNPAEPVVWLHEITAPALVLGSTQRDDVVDVAACRRAGVEVVRRRSGGGAVWLAPGEVVWIDVIVPVGHAGWADDIHRPMVWLGHHLARAFDAVGVDGVDVHDGPMETTPQSRLVCFDGLGPGEVTRHGGKLVGMSQRRTRSAARLQCCWYTQHEHDSLAELLLPEVSVDDLRPVATVDSTSAAAVVPLLAASLG